jgi:hypothetical protein
MGYSPTIMCICPTSKGFMPERNKIVRKIHQQNENCCHFVLIRQQRFLEKARKNFWNGDVAIPKIFWLLFYKKVTASVFCLIQTACKPGSVPAVAGDGRPFLWDGCHHPPRCDQPGRRGEDPLAIHALPHGAGRPYSVLLPVGFTLPALLPGPRCALTAPFHPYLGFAPLAVCFLWHCPWGRPRRPLAGTVSPWSPDFPPAVTRQRPSSRLDQCCLCARAGAPSTTV